MSIFAKITSEAGFESTEIEPATSEGLEDYSFNKSAPVDKPNTFSLSHKNPELHSVMTHSEILNVSHSELTHKAIDACFLQAQNELVSHFELKLNSLPDDVRADFLQSLDLQSNYKPEFPLFAQVLKSSYA